MIQYFKKINNTASLYDYFDYENNPYQNFRTKIIIDEISDIVHSYSGVVRILDIGCANGFIISKLCSSLGEKIECTGIDFLEENIAEAKILSNQTFICNDLSEFEKLIERHENMISKIINIDPIQKSTFSDYNKGIIKSLGSWGGDFILVSGEKEDLNYFRDKGYNTIYDLEDLVYLN